jgi:hypothetical protein
MHHRRTWKPTSATTATAARKAVRLRSTIRTMDDDQPPR